MSINPEHEPASTQEVVRRSLLGGALSMEYGPCSVAASELVNAAHHFQDLRRATYGDKLYNKTKHYFVVDELNTPVTKRLLAEPIQNIHEVREHYDVRKIHESLGLVVAQTVNTFTETGVERTVVKKRFGREKIPETPKEIKKYRLAELWLADDVLGHVLMPLATFEKRIDGNCKYIQLGPEITDDSVFAVEGDEETERLGIVDDLRKLFPRSHSNEKEVSERLKNFVLKERLRRAPQLTIALAASLEKSIRGVERYYKKKASFVNVLPDNRVEHFDDSVRFTQFGSSQEEDTPNEIAAFSVTNSDGVSLVTIGALTRGNVLLPIVEINGQTGEACFIHASHLSYKEKLMCIVALYCINDQKNNFTEERVAKLKEEYRTLIGDAVNDPKRFIFDLIYFDKKKDQILQPECDSQEKLARAIGKKAVGITYSGLVHDVPMINTIGDVSGNITLERSGDIFQAKVVAKPAALEEMPESQIACLTYDAAQPLGDSLPEKEDAEEFANLINGFNKTDQSK